MDDIPCSKQAVHSPFQSAVAVLIRIGLIVGVVIFPVVTFLIISQVQIALVKVDFAFRTVIICDKRPAFNVGRALGMRCHIRCLKVNRPDIGDAFLFWRLLIIPGIAVFAFSVFTALSLIVFCAKERDNAFF